MSAASKTPPAGSRPRPLWGKADDTEEETGIRTPWDRRGKGPSIRGKIRRDNVGKIPVAAGGWKQPAETSCTRLRPKERRARVRRSDDRGVMSSQETAYTSPQWGNTDIGQRDSGHLAVPSSSAAARHRAGGKPARPSSIPTVAKAGWNLAQFRAVLVRMADRRECSR